MSEHILLEYMGASILRSQKKTLDSQALEWQAVFRSLMQVLKLNSGSL